MVVRLFCHTPWDAPLLHMLDPTVVLHHDKINVDAFKSMVDDLFFYEHDTALRTASRIVDHARVNGAGQ